MKLRYRPVIGVSMVAVSLFILGVSLLVGFSPNTVTGVILLLVGIGYLTRPLAELTADRLTVFALLGPLKKEYLVQTLRLSGEKLFAGDQKVSIHPLLVNRKDWQALKKRLGAA
jgi:hypothetical protein